VDGIALRHRSPTAHPVGASGWPGRPACGIGSQTAA